MNQIAITMDMNKITTSASVTAISVRGKDTQKLSLSPVSNHILTIGAIKVTDAINAVR